MKWIKNTTIYWNLINFWNMLKCNHGKEYLYEIDQRIPEKRCLACECKEPLHDHHDGCPSCFNIK